MSNERLASALHDARVVPSSAAADDRAARDMAMMERFFLELPATGTARFSRELELLVRCPVDCTTATFIAFLCHVLVHHPRTRLGQYLRNEAATFVDFNKFWRQKITETSRLRKELEDCGRGY